MHSADWIEVLRTACANQTQLIVAQKLGYSITVINQILSGKYAGRADRVEQRVRSVLMSAGVECPILGQISGERCLAERRRPFAATNSMRVLLWRTCRQCENNPDAIGDPNYE